MSIIFKRNCASIYIFCHFTVDYSFHHQLWLENKTIDIVLIKILFIRVDNQTATKNRAKYTARKRSVRVGKRLQHERCKNRQNLVKITPKYPFKFKYSINIFGNGGRYNRYGELNHQI